MHRQTQFVRYVLWPAAVASYVLAASGAVKSTFAGYDFVPVWKAGRAVLHGADPYSASPELPFVYPPSALILAAPFGAMPYDMARGGFLLIELLLLPLIAAGCLRLVQRPIWSAPTGR